MNDIGCTIVFYHYVRDVERTDVSRHQGAVAVRF